jgi:hypothetical protein
MSTRSILIALCVIATTSLNGCAAYTVASMGSYAVTGKGIGDHAGSALSGGDCNVIKHTYEGKYVCEMPVVYNRNAF